MALVHSVQCGSVKEMVVGVAEVYTQFEPRDPIPTWWQEFVKWTESQGINSIENLEKLLVKVEKEKERPVWWKDAEKQYKKAKSVKIVTLRTEAFSEDASPTEDEEDGDFDAAYSDEDMEPGAEIDEDDDEKEEKEDEEEDEEEEKDEEEEEEKEEAGKE